MLIRLDEKLRTPTKLTHDEFAQLVAFLRTGLLDQRARPERLARLIPEQLPSALEPLEFEVGD